MSQSLSRIFLLSHMRAYTSLLGHILGSHPQINGYYEMQQGYTSVDDLTRQQQEYARHDALKPGSSYLFDKLLHNGYPLKLETLSSADVTILLALRQPEAAIKSIIKLFADKNTNALYADPAEATHYYIQRLEQLAAFARQYPQRYYYFDAELIRTDTGKMLATLGQWLRLNTPLSANYQHFSKTGVAGAGDTSPSIKSGTVLSAATPYPDVVLETGLLAQARQAYQECRQQLVTNALEHYQANN
ncbi:MAG: hypothetical protein JG718_10935 [Candidatus Thiothrix moscowensis]|nr:hypothetical protein [Candidatus Thiothrix moscowensis]